MRLVLRLAGPVIVLALAAAGCGGAQATVQEVPGGPAQLTVPGDGEALKPAATAEGTATPTPTATAEAADTPAAGQSGTGDSAADSGPSRTAGGGTAAPGGDDTATTDQPPPAGSDAQQFEDFCAQNPGAC
jgi:hypothetical protein